ncbi:undecaprenyl/decaprenyl-phosphate alpha-N-acetylglucosaminyl 1-phosphate transferase [Radiobacillus kanasensis]|uniref:MraY family glycosyltransferase n=1 Tax=Radiobacillus kanasensis TaxID=2844358 RepID=UPI001E51C71D|nr:MraY family glycosyltransferase [Radiobacillus kanasensis]UFT98895.1 undecaprenyl/decaprenyl-phosphate alpha-N-acetylglucosaminyl 1-phosphate transferase [Radiobacillus kanasensis]
MYHIPELVVAFCISLLSTLILVYPIKKLAMKIGAIDHPNYRKVHTKATPRLGGLAIFLGVVIGLLYIRPEHPQLLEIVLGAFIIVITGLLDDKYQLKPILKLSGQIAATIIVISSGLIIDRITIPLLGVIELHGWSIIVTFFWIIGITNAINLIDGLDGLAAGVSTIALMSITVMAFMDYRMTVIYFCIVLIASNLGFLFHNFHPAKIYMGDTGSMFLGYSIAVISIMGLFKNITLFSFVIPIIVLAVPIFDTLFAMLRRFINGESIMMPDKKHFHHNLLAAGFSHRATVLIIYGFSAVFGISAIVFSNASLVVSILISFVILLLLHIIAEVVGIVGKGKRPIVQLTRKSVMKIKNKKQVKSSSN